MVDKTRIALIFGGESSEHGISCLTAASVMEAIDKEQFEVVGIGISPTGRWSQVPLEIVTSYRIVEGKPPQVAEPTKDAVWSFTKGACEIATRDGERLLDVNRVDVAFALLHGPNGEDGTIQGMFEIMGLPYVGAGVLASAVGMDKQFMKMAFEAAGLPVGPYVVASRHRLEFEHEAVLTEVATLNYPIFVKPARGGSSIGISRVSTPDELDAAIKEAQRFDPKVIFEQGFVGAREFEVAVLGDPKAPEGCRASVPGEIQINAADGFYDYETKYFAEDSAALDAPAQTSPGLATELQELARRPFNAIEAEGLVRVGFFVTDEGAWVSEVNTMPGLTCISMYPTLWQVSGLTYERLVSRLIELALERPVGLR